MRIRTCLLAWIGLSCVAALSIAPFGASSASAQAQAAPDAPDAARDHFRRGEAAYQKGSYDVAIPEWVAASGS